MATTLVSLHPAVLSSAPGAPAATINRCLVEAARELCRTANAWRADIASFNTVASQAEYTITPPTGGLLVDVISGRVENLGPLTVKAPELIDAEDSLARSTDNPPKYIYRSGSNKVSFAPVPSAAQAVALRGAFQPAINATTLDDKLVDDYGDTIIHGALSRILAIPQKPWTDLSLSGYHGGMFTTEVARISSHAAGGGSKNSTRTVAYGGIPS